MFWKIAFKNNTLIGLRTKSLFGWCFAHFCNNVFIYYFIIIIIIYYQHQPQPQPSTTTASHHSPTKPTVTATHPPATTSWPTARPTDNHILTHCKTHHKPAKPNLDFNKTPPLATTDQQNSTARERDRSHRKPCWARERSASDWRSPAPPWS